MKTAQFRGKYGMREGTTIGVEVSVFLYKEDKIHYALCPALDIIDYGNTEKEAKESFQIMIKEIITDAVRRGTLFAMLQAYGWDRTQPPETTDLINRYEGLADIINGKAYRAVQQRITIPCV